MKTTKNAKKESQAQGTWKYMIRWITPSVRSVVDSFDVLKSVRRSIASSFLQLFHEQPPPFVEQLPVVEQSPVFDEALGGRWRGEIHHQRDRQD